MIKSEAETYCLKMGYTNLNFQEIGKLIGEGADGNVYKYGSNKVIKFTDLGIYYDWDDMKEFIPIIKNYKAFPKIYKSGSVQSYFYWIVMEWLPRSLKKDDFKTLSILESVLNYEDKITELPKLWRPLAKSLLHLERTHKYIYEDIHYHNLRYDKKGRPKVIDFESFTKR